PTSDDVDAYVAEALDRYDNTSDKLDVIVKEYLIAQWGNGLEAYNIYRRTGKPANMPPLVDPQAAVSASFPRTMLYPAVNVDLNQNATQKETTVQVFWDVLPGGFLR
ncbi:MAG: SusD/RagB family nutrient-binding outer membrane lipoprotein, partial [Saprospiraceae bacterium]